MKVIPERRFINEELAQAVREKCGNVCMQCGTSKHLEYDHIVPVSEGGKTELDNLQMLCKRCNIGKRDDNKPPLVLREIARQPVNVGGAPPKYKTPEELQAKIQDYFDNGIAKRAVIIGNANNRQEVLIPVPTITGLVLHCGFCDRQSFYDQEKREGFSHTIKKARSFIEKEYEEQMQSGNVVGAIFALKNFGWIDHQELDVRDITFKEEVDPPPSNEGVKDVQGQS